MAQNAPVLYRPCLRKGKPFPTPNPGTGSERRASVLLFFPLDAMMLRTPFRIRVLHLIYEIAHRELGNRIASVVVQASPDPDDPSHVGLLLSIWADVDKHQWQAADRAISGAVFEQETNWTEEERADYLKMIEFEVLPLKI